MKHVKQSTQVDSVNIARRRSRVLTLRSQGFTVEEITHIWNSENPDMRIGESTIRNDIRLEMKRLAEETKASAEEMRTVAVRRLEKLYANKRFQEKIERGDLGAYDRAIKISGELARLYGVYAPTKIAQTNADGSDIEKLSEQERERLLIEVFSKARERALLAEPENTDSPDYD